MKKMKSVLFGIAAVVAVLVAGPRPAYAERTLKVHPSVQNVLSSTTYTNISSSVTASVDLSGGDMDIIGCAFYVNTASSTGTPTLDAAIQISPDGGTNWVTAGSFTQVTSTTTSVGTTYLKNDVSTLPGTKARIKFTSAANTTWGGVKAWCTASQK